jgi:hypothetical protein
LKPGTSPFPKTCFASTAIVSHPKPSANIPGASHNSRVAPGFASTKRKLCFRQTRK